MRCPRELNVLVITIFTGFWRGYAESIYTQTLHLFSLYNINSWTAKLVSWRKQGRFLLR